MEEWRPVEGYDRYEVSSYGRIRRLPIVTRTRHAFCTRPLKILKPVLNAKGYFVVDLTQVAYKPKKIELHRIVAKTFVAPYGGLGLEVAHLDHNTLNCRADNLAWKTHRENMLDTAEAGVFHAAINPKRHNCGPQARI